MLPVLGRIALFLKLLVNTRFFSGFKVRRMLRHSPAQFVFCVSASRGLHDLFCGQAAACVVSCGLNGERLVGAGIQGTLSRHRPDPGYGELAVSYQRRHGVG